MGWDNSRYPKTKKDTFVLSFIHFGISRPSFSDYRISLIDLGFPIPDFLILGYPRDISKKPKDILRYPAPAHISDLSLRHSCDIPKEADLS
jgi:hypothetical protein